MRVGIFPVALAWVIVSALSPTPARAGACTFDRETRDLDSGVTQVEVQSKLASDWSLGFRRTGDDYTVFLTVGTFAGGGAPLPEGQRFLAHFKDGTTMRLTSVEPAVVRVVGSYVEYTFTFATTLEAVQAFGGLGLEGFQMTLFGEVQQGVPDSQGRKSARRNANCVQDLRSRG